VVNFYAIFNRPYLSNGRAIGMAVVHLSLCLFVRSSVTDVRWLTGKLQEKTFCTNN